MVGCMEEALTGKTDMTAKGLGMHLPPRIDAALASAVRTDPKARWRTAGELWEEIKLGIREHASSARVPAQMLVPGGEPSTRSPASLAPDTETDPVFSVAPSSRDDVGGTVMMENAPRPPCRRSVAVRVADSVESAAGGAARGRHARGPGGHAVAAAPAGGHLGGDAPPPLGLRGGGHDPRAPGGGGARGRGLLRVAHLQDPPCVAGEHEPMTDPISRSLFERA